MKILIVRVSSLGDVIHTLPAEALLRKLIPNAEIHWIAQKKCIDILRIHTSINTVWELPNHYLSPKNWLHTWKTIQQLRIFTWDAIIDFQGLLKTSFLTLFLKGNKFGFSHSQARCSITSYCNNYTTTIDFKNIIQKNLGLASFAAYTLTKNKSNPASFTLCNNSAFNFSLNLKKTVHEWLNNNTIKKFIILSPNTTWESKHWPLVHWELFLKLLAKNNYFITNSITIILVGEQFGIQGAHLAQCIKTNNLPIIILPPWNLEYLSYLITMATLIIAPDTGILHLADFLGIKALGIFGPTHAVQHGPFLQKINASHAIQIKCPHYYEKSHKKNIKTGKTKNCMYTLTPNVLIQKTLNIINA